MKNFDFPYINDSPVDLSGREGAPRYIVCDDCGFEGYDEDHECTSENDYGKIDDAGEEAADSDMQPEDWER